MWPWIIGYLLFLINGDFLLFSYCLFSYLPYICGFEIIVVNSVSKLFFKLVFYLILLKSSSKDITGTHWSRSSTPKRRDMMVCTSEMCGVRFYMFIVDFQCCGHRSNRTRLVTHEFLLCFPVKTLKQMCVSKVQRRALTLIPRLFCKPNQLSALPCFCYFSNDGRQW